MPTLAADQARQGELVAPDREMRRTAKDHRIISQFIKSIPISQSTTSVDLDQTLIYESIGLATI